MNEEQPFPRTEADEIAEQNTDQAWAEHFGEEPAAQAVPEPATPPEATALAEPETPVAGFAQNESGLLVPDGTAQVAMGEHGLVTDRRRMTREKIEEDFANYQEALKAPLTESEQLDAVNRLQELVSAKLEAAKKADIIGERTVDDLQGDQNALYRLKQMIGGDYVNRGYDAQNKSRGMSIRDRLDDLVKNYGALTPENFKNDRWIGSMGGTVQVGEDGQVHSGGYNNSLLYAFARARQLYDGLTNDPATARETLLPGWNLAGVPVDESWLLNQAVVLSDDDTLRREVAL